MASNMTFKANLNPQTDLDYELGNSTKRWKINGVTDPKLTDEKVTQTNSTTAADYRILLSGSANDTTATEGANKSTNLRFNPSTKLLSIGGDLSATGDLTITGDAYLNGETYVDDITAGSLLVTGAASFTNIPTAPTPATSSNDTSIATTAFVKNNLGGLSGAMHFKGTTTTAMSDGLTTAAVTISGSSYTPSAGDVVLYSDSEFVWTGSAWERLGRDSSFKVTQTAVSAATTASNTTTTRFVSAIEQDTNGNIKYTTQLLPTYSNNAGTVTSITPGNGLLNGTGTSAITSSGTLNLNYGTSASAVSATAAAGSANTVSRSDHVHSISVVNDTINLSRNTETTIATIAGTAIKIKLPASDNTDAKVKQSASTTSNWRKVLLHYKDDATSTTAVTDSTNQVYATVGISVQPSTNTLRAAAFNIADHVTLQYNSTTNALDFVFA